MNRLTKTMMAVTATKVVLGSAERFLLCLVGIFAIGICVFVGFFPTFAVDRGPGPVFTQALCLVLIVLALTGGTIFMFTKRWLLALGIGLGLAVCAYIPSGLTLAARHDQAASVHEMAPKVQAVGTARFREIDTNNDSLIAYPELWRAIYDLPLTGDERKALIYMRDHIDEIGHAIAPDAYMRGISEQDLVQYPDLAAEKYKQWS